MSEHGVDFIVVGGVCAVLHGAPVTTFDIDLVHCREPGNLTSLLSALEALDAYYRGHSSRRFGPRASHLRSDGHHLLMTRAGPLDLLGTVGLGDSYETLVSRTTELLVAEKIPVRVLNLDTLIQLKEMAGREKDLAALPVLKSTLAEQRRRDGEG